MKNTVEPFSEGTIGKDLLRLREDAIAMLQVAACRLSGIATVAVPTVVFGGRRKAVSFS